MANTPEYTRKAVDNYRKKFDIMQLRLPKGTRERIEKQADKVHDFVVACVLAELERLETPAERDETHQIESEQEQTEKIAPEESNPEETENNSCDTNNKTLADLQALIDQKRAEQKEREEMLERAKQERKEQEKAKEREETNKIICRIIGGEEPEEDAEKEMIREKTIINNKYNCN